MRYFPLLFSPENDVRFQKLINVYNDQQKLREIQQSKVEFLDELIGKLHNRSLIISSEHLFRLPLKGIEAIWDYLRPTCREIKVIAYARDPLSFCISAWSTRLGSGESSIPFLSPSFFNDADCTKYIQRWKTVFGDKLTIRYFDNRYLNNGNIIDDFCKFLGLNFSECNFTSPERANASLSYRSMCLLHSLNKGIPFFIRGRANPYHQFISSQIIDKYGSGEKFLPTSADISTFNDHFYNYKQLLSDLTSVPASAIGDQIKIRNPEDKYLGNLEKDIKETDLFYLELLARTWKRFVSHRSQH